MFSLFKRNKAPTLSPVAPAPILPPFMHATPSFGWGKALGMFFAVLLPAILIVYANTIVFPESSWLASGMVLSTCGIALIFAIASGRATQGTRRYCLVASLVLAVVLSANLVGHWVLARELSAAKQATSARHTEEDRAEARREAEAKRQKELIAEQKALVAQQTKQLRAEAIRNDSAVRLGLRAPRGTRISAPQPVAITQPTAEPSAEPAPPADAPKQLTVEEVMAKWSWRLLWFAVADLLSSVVAFGICALLWEWDKNRNGIPDHLEQLLLWQQYQQYLAQQAPPAHSPLPRDTSNDLDTGKLPRHRM